MSMEMTWLEFQLSIDNQNGRYLATNFFLQNSLETWYIWVFGVCGAISNTRYPFLCEIENEAAAAILVLLILINRFYFQLNALKS